MALGAQRTHRHRLSLLQSRNLAMFALPVDLVLVTRDRLGDVAIVRRGFVLGRRVFKDTESIRGRSSYTDRATIGL